jgi:hypothetical protein
MADVNARVIASLGPERSIKLQSSVLLAIVCGPPLQTSRSVYIPYTYHYRVGEKGACVD